MPIQPKQQPPYYQEGINVKTYVALITQNGTNAPVATILHNTYQGTPTWARVTDGQYTATLTGQ